MQQEQVLANLSIPHELRRVPSKQLIYVADGPSDVCIAVVEQMGENLCSI